MSYACVGSTCGQRTQHGMWKGMLQGMQQLAHAHELRLRRQRMWHGTWRCT